MESHTFLLVHMVWSTRGRSPTITAPTRRLLYPYLAFKAEQLGCRTLAIGGMPDHIHVVARVHPAVSISQLAQEMKGASAHRLNRIPGRKEPRLVWQGGYGAFSFWYRHTRAVVRYVESQQERHEARKWIRMAQWNKELIPTPGPRDGLLELIDDEYLLVDEWEQAHPNETPEEYGMLDGVGIRQPQPRQGLGSL